MGKTIMLEKNRRQQEKRKTMSNLRWIDSIKEALSRSLPTGAEDRRLWASVVHRVVRVRADSVACTKTNHAMQFLPLS